MLSFLCPKAEKIIVMPRRRSRLFSRSVSFSHDRRFSARDVSHLEDFSILLLSPYMYSVRTPGAISDPLGLLRFHDQASGTWSVNKITRGERFLTRTISVQILCRIYVESCSANPIDTISINGIRVLLIVIVVLAFLVFRITHSLCQVTIVPVV